MKSCKCRLRSLLAFAALGPALALAGPAAAEQSNLRDHVIGSDDVINWTAGIWSLDGNELETCTTFPDGVETNQDYPEGADSLVCAQTPDGWRWDVTLPSGTIVSWTIDGLPVDTEVCGEIFYSPMPGSLEVFADVLNDIITVRTPDSRIVYDGPWSAFEPGEHGLVPSAIRRCGLVRAVGPTSAETMTWGRLKSLHP